MTSGHSTSTAGTATPPLPPGDERGGTEPDERAGTSGPARSTAIAVAAVSAAALLQWLLSIWPGPGVLYLPFGIAVVLTAWFAGRAAGYGAAMLSAIIAAAFFLDPSTGTAGQLAWFVILAVTGLAGAYFVTTLKEGRREAEARALAAETVRYILLAEQRQTAETSGDVERQLRYSDARSRLLIDAVSEYAIIMLDADGRILDWNEGARRIAGYTAEEVSGRHFSLLHPEADQHAGAPAGALTCALKDGVHEEDGWRVRKDGTQLWANVIITPIMQDDMLVGFAHIMRDHTHRHSSEVLLESIIGSAIDGIVGVDEHGRIRSFNAAAQRMFGYDADAVTGLPFSVLLPEPYRTNGTEYLMRYARSGHARIVGRGRQLVGLRADGTTFPLELAVSEFELHGSRYFTGIVRDITRQRALEDQLQQAQKMQAIGQLAGGVAHDFNNLLTIIAGHTELLLGRYKEPGELHHALGDIRDAGMRAAGLTRQLLAFSRRAVLEPRILDLNVLVQETQRMLRRIVSEDVEMVTRLDPKLHRVSVDQSQIGQVLINLVVNASDAVNGGGRIEIETANGELTTARDARPTAHPAPTVVLTVRDNGTGMTPDIMKRIFEPFFTTKPAGAGTGLGLSMVYGMVRQSGGDVEVHSEPGAGSEFRVVLPAAHHGAAEAAQPHPVRETERGGSETLLVVEDEESVRRLAVLALREHGYTVIEAANGAEALRTLGGFSGDIDLVVTDVVMPVMGGRQLVEALKPLRPNARVLYVSGYTDDAVIRHGVQRADVAFLQKPYSPGDLADKVRRVLDGHD
ncbi:MAG: PAS domain S-box protein [Gemmatimonadetes bacterium]|nr:PAS domain S-box protein [Gemmatimonadota bacterium]